MSKIPSKVLIVGSYASSYSLAAVNRGLLRGLRNVYPHIASYIWQRPPEFVPLEKYTYNKSFAAEWSMPSDSLTNDANDVDFLLYSHFPGDSFVEFGLSKLSAKQKGIYIFWEESIFPSRKVNEINRDADIVFVGSNFVGEVLHNSGVTKPVYVLPCGVDLLVNEERTKPDFINTQKGFVFLNISTAKERKGIDVLIRAYLEEFSHNDNVTLILKTSPNQNNKVDSLISRERQRTHSQAKILHICNAKLTSKEISELISFSNCGVYPSRAEGFGLPIAESMKAGVPVISTAYSAQLDFINKHNAYLLDYQLTNSISSENVNPRSVWAEPDSVHLKTLLRKAYAECHTPQQITQIKKAQKTISQFTWENAASRLIKSLEIPTKVNFDIKILPRVFPQIRHQLNIKASEKVFIIEVDIFDESTLLNYLAQITAQFDNYLIFFLVKNTSEFSTRWQQNMTRLLSNKSWGMFNIIDQRIVSALIQTADFYISLSYEKNEFLQELVEYFDVESWPN